jgi:hypothetical protein
MIDNLDLAIEQIKYIAGSNILKKMKKADEKEKKDLFLDFWNKKIQPRHG